MHHHVQIDVETGCMCVPDETAKRVYAAVTRGQGALLILAAKVAAIKHSVPITAIAGATLGLGHWRQLDRGKADVSQPPYFTRKEV
jgi:hypothetical protein